MRGVGVASILVGLEGYVCILGWLRSLSLSLRLRSSSIAVIMGELE